MLNGKAAIALLIVELIKKDIASMSEYFPEPKSSGEKVEDELDWYNYAAKTDLKNAAGVDTSKYAKKVNLTSL